MYMKKYDVIIIGGGASGLMCAMQINNKSVLIIEKQDKIGKKILVTGNGRCNLTNLNIKNNFYNTEQVNKYFNNINNVKTLEYFKSIGLETYCDSEGRYYPVSNYSASVLDIMRLNISKKSNITILTNCTAKKIKQNSNTYLVCTNIDDFICDNLVFATGGNFDNIFDFNLKYSKFTPALCSFKTEKNKGLNGIRQKDVVVSLINNEIYSQKGEVLFKENGISGICIFNLSLHYNYNQNNILKIDLLPKYSYEQLISLLKERVNIFEKCENLLTSLFQKQLCLSILDKSNIDNQKYCNELTDNEIEKIYYVIKNYTIKIIDLDSNNQIHNGGVNLNQLNDALEHNQFKKLYFIGESCDVSGECGGYNLQWAWTSGQICGSHLNNN